MKSETVGKYLLLYKTLWEREKKNCLIIFIHTLLRFAALGLCERWVDL